MANNTKVLDVAKFFLEKENFMTHKKLQKLVYYAYAWYMVRNNQPGERLMRKLFEGRIEAWVHGPVCRELYDRYSSLNKYVAQALSTSEKDLLEKIWLIYGKYTGAELENLTHKEEPWKTARGKLAGLVRSSKVIKDRDIYEYYHAKLNS